MKIGTRSVLYGAHQFIIHPLFVLAAWIKLYGCPTWRELIAIIIHDWGYWGSPNMDGPEGEEHPAWAAAKLHKLGDKWYRFEGKRRSGKIAWLRAGNEVLYHSRFWAKKHGAEPSRLCWADKLGTAWYPTFLWCFLTRLTGEIHEYMDQRKYEIHLGINMPTDTAWKFFKRYKEMAAGWIVEQVENDRVRA